MVIGIYLPLKSREEDLQIIARGFGDEARRYEVTIVAGQTATYNGLETPLITSTCFGEQVRRPERPREGDNIVVIGNVGGESLWLNDLSRGNGGDEWKQFTPLNAALRLQECRGVKMMHDVSEGGVKGALKEVADTIGRGIKVKTERLPYAEGIKEIAADVLSAPTYGTLISIVGPNFTEDVIETCDKMGYPSAVIGLIKEGEGLHIDGERVKDIERTKIDELYGIFEPSL
jgi:hydrogenase maturation factor